MSVGGNMRKRATKRCIWTTERPAKNKLGVTTHDRCCTWIPRCEVEARGAAVCDEHLPAYRANQNRLANSYRDKIAAVRARLDPGCLADA
jgi:hypothetical protein